MLFLSTTPKGSTYHKNILLPTYANIYNEDTRKKSTKTKKTYSIQLIVILTKFISLSELFMVNLHNDASFARNMKQLGWWLKRYLFLPKIFSVVVAFETSCRHFNFILRAFVQKKLFSVRCDYNN